MVEVSKLLTPRGLFGDDIVQLCNVSVTLYDGAAMRFAPEDLALAVQVGGPGAGVFAPPSPPTQGPREAR